jgi:hypothetical protein
MFPNTPKNEGHKLFAFGFDIFANIVTFEFFFWGHT